MCRVYKDYFEFVASGKVITLDDVVQFWSNRQHLLLLKGDVGEMRNLLLHTAFYVRREMGIEYFECSYPECGISEASLRLFN